MRIRLSLAALLLAWPLFAQTEYVNPFIGTTNFGACNPGAVTPNGLMSVTPSQKEVGPGSGGST